MLKLLDKSILLIFGAIFCIHPADAPPNKLQIQFFGSSTCGECLEIKELILKPLMRRYPETLEITLYDVEDTAAFSLMTRLEEKFHVTSPMPQELFFPDTVILGYEAINAHGEQRIKEYLADPSRWKSTSNTNDSTRFKEALQKRVGRFTFWGVTAAGLVDGVNPCAIATLIFLLSFLATQKRKRSEILMIGLTFAAVVYITYVLMGAGAFKAITMLGQYRWLSLVIRWGAVAAAGVVGILSLWDAFAYKRSGKTADITLQLPKAVKMQIHKVISTNLKGSQLFWGAIVTGFLVTLLEAVCTGQVYLPTIVLMTRAEGLRVQGWIYLMYYNLLFVLPLLLVIILAYFGLTWSKLSKMTQKNLSLLKISMGVIMIGMAIFLAMA
jgi:cytochrome c biogenesis protein CcdA